MKQLKSIKQCLVSQVQTQLGDLKNTNVKELGEVIDMIKDLEEAMYYCAIITAMEEKEEQPQNNINYYMEQPRSDYDIMPKRYTPYMEYAPYMMRDDKWRDTHLYDGRSGASRRMYMEGKLGHTSNDVQSMKELETYIKDFSDDMIDMVKESTPEEKQVLSNKLQALASKVNTVK